MSARRQRAPWLAVLLFLGPSLAGVLVFVAIPIVASLVLSLTDWDLSRHNPFTREPLRFVGLANHVEVLSRPDTWRFLGNTLFLMLGVPVAMAGSLLLAVLLHGVAERAGRRGAAWPAMALAGALAAGGVGWLLAGGGALAAGLLAVGVVAAAGALGRGAVYLPLLYSPSFTSGVATFILWKKLYHPDDGPINALLRPMLATLEAAALELGPGGVGLVASLLLAGVLLVGVAGARAILAGAEWGDVTRGVALACVATLLAWPAAAVAWWPSREAAIAGLCVAAGAMAWMASRALREGSARRATGNGRAWLLAGMLVMAQGALLGVALATWQLASVPEGGLQPPNWLAEYHWAKPALMIMGLWMAVGSNNLVLYMAGLAAVSRELHEAAEVDGAGPVARLWHITLPEVAPVTAFILIMSLIGGLQGGFEIARSMTQGGPAGATMTLAYAVYDEGFQAGRLGQATALAWLVFLLVLGATALLARRRREDER